MKKIAFLLVCIISSSIVFGQNENYTIKNIKANKKFQDFGVSYYGDSTAVFSSSGKSVFMKRVWSGNHEPFLSLYQGAIAADGEINNVKQFGKTLDTKYHESNLTFTKDLKTVYFSRNNYFHKKYKTNSDGVNLIQLYKAQINENGEWINIERLPFNSDQYDSGHPALNKDESKLYFVSNMPGTYGDTDVFVVDILTDGSYGVPVNLGPTINTSKKEMFPFIDENDNLYFSSNGYNEGKGGLDIYVTKRSVKGKYFKPKNLGYPVNSNMDDFAFVKQKSKNKGYFSSNRKGGKGDDDIYSFIEINPIVFDCPELISGIVTNSKDNTVIPSSKVTLYHNNLELASVLSDSGGFYQFNIQCKSNYKIIATKRHFDQSEIEIKSEDDSSIEANLTLSPEKNDHFIRVRNQVMLNIKPIYFDLEKATIKPVSKPELQMVVDLMNKYPEIIIQIRAHTDSRGLEDFNLKLSQKRANSSMNWLLNKGIHKDRVFAVGFGESELVNECKSFVNCSDEKHQENRRTEFVILNPVVIGH